VLPTDELQQSLQRSLGEAAVRLRAARFPSALCDSLLELGSQVGDPCVMAVVGKVKAGKSSLINSLLGTELAAVGTTETTATVNWFRFGKPDADRPVRCIWRDGPPTFESTSFIARLQGHSEETLELASRIDRLEFLLERELLKSVIVVDTPGLDAEPDEHQNKTAEFLGLHSQLRADLRARHHEETQRMAQDADAVMYVFDPVLKNWEQRTLEQFQQMIQKGTSTFNSLGVLGKIDALLDDVDAAPQLARRIERGLGDAITTVIPVSVGLLKAAELLRHEPETLRLMLTLVREADSETMELLLANDELFVMDLPDALPTAEWRAALSRQLPWTVLQTMIKVMERHKLRPENCIVELEKFGGFDTLRSVIQRTFAARGRLLRSHRIVCEADRRLEHDAYPFISKCRDLDRADQEKRARCLTFLQRLSRSSAPQDKAVIAEIREHLEISCGRVLREPEADGHIRDVRMTLSRFRRQLEVYSEDLLLLQTVSELRSLLTEAEIDELETLFGKHRLELRDRLSVTDPLGYCRVRQEYWRLRTSVAKDIANRTVFEAAGRRYGAILYELAKGSQVK
jgi:Dynamin family